MTGPAFRNLLYREPGLYDLVFPEGVESMTGMVGAAVDRWAPVKPRSILDLGCGNGRHLWWIPSMPGHTFARKR